MKAIIFGASGMVGQGVLRECLASPEVEGVLLVGRSASGVSHAKVREIVHADLYDYAGISDQLGGYDACFFCLGVSSSGLSEAEYHRVTYELTLAAAKALRVRNPGMTFCYVSGEGTDGTEKGRTMWARVKGKTENALLDLGFAHAHMFRPGYIQPLGGIKSKTTAYRILYAAMGPLYPIWKAILPAHVTTTENVGRAMVHVALHAPDKAVLETPDINAIAAQATAG